MTAGHAEQPKDLGLCLLGLCVFFFLLSNKLFRFSVFLALLWTFDVFNSAAPGESESKVNPAVGSAVNRSGSSGRPTEYKPSPELEWRNYRLPHTSNLILFTRPTNPGSYPGEGGNPDVVLRSLVLLLIPSPGWERCCACTAKINMTEHKALINLLCLWDSYWFKKEKMSEMYNNSASNIFSCFERVLWSFADIFCHIFNKKINPELK